MAGKTAKRSNFKHSLESHCLEEDLDIYSVLSDCRGIGKKSKETTSSKQFFKIKYF